MSNPMTEPMSGTGVTGTGRGIETPRVLFIADSTRGHVTQRARGTVYRDLFARDGWAVTFMDSARTNERQLVNAARNHDLVYLLKVASLPLINRLRNESGARLVFDFCDRLWSSARQKNGWQDLDGILAAVDAVFGENTAICDYARDYARVRVPAERVFCVPDSAQVELFDAARSSDLRRPEEHNAHGDTNEARVRIGWVGSQSTVGALENIREPLRRVLARHPHADLHIVGARSADAARVLAGVPHTVVPEYDEAGMIREMLALDIGLYPPPFDDEDYRARGPLKALLYMAAGVPPVCRRVGDCAVIVKDGENGMLAESPDEWERKLEALVIDGALRRRLGAAALADARRSHSLESTYVTLCSGFVAVMSLPALQERPATWHTPRSRDARSLLVRWGARLSRLFRLFRQFFAFRGAHP